jgi:tRNA(Ile)-lysidine synthase
MQTSVATTEITSENFCLSMEKLWPHKKAGKFAIAVSGGSDSLALCFLSYYWLCKRSQKPAVLIVDHQLRATSREEALKTQELLTSWSIQSVILTVDASCYQGPMLLAARNARYDVMTGYCRANGITQLLLGHNLDDQIETFLLRLEAGSGLLGLASMPAISNHFTDVELWRPLLDYPKPATADWLQKSDIKWVEDPSNKNENYKRIWYRQKSRELQNQGITINKIPEFITVLGKWRQKEQKSVNRLLKATVHTSEFGWLSMPVSTLAEIQPARLNLITDILVAFVRGKSLMISPKSVRQLGYWLERTNSSSIFTLGGCLFQKRNGSLYVFREYRNLPMSEPMRVGTRIWDSRIRLSMARAFPNGATIAALGEIGWKSLDEQHRKALKDIMPVRAAWTLPAIWLSNGELKLPWFPELQLSEDTHIDSSCSLTFLNEANLPRPIFLVV